MSQVGDSRGNAANNLDDIRLDETFIAISKFQVAKVTEMDYESDYKEKFLDLTTRPKVLLDSERNMLAIFLDPEQFASIIKMINGKTESIFDADIIMIAKLWKQFKPMLENLEIKNI